MTSASPLSSLPLNKMMRLADGPFDGFPGVVRAGPLVFVSGCDGHRDRSSGQIVPALAADAERQCENAYGRIEALLQQAGTSMDRVVRLDHFTSSQDWLPRRQAVRQRIFGKPAPLASTGIAAKMNGINMITASVVAVTDPEDKEVLVEGPHYAMENISAAVRGGPFVFISGIRGTVDPTTGRRVSEEKPESFGAQTKVCYEVIKSILKECGLSADSLLRIDCYIRDGSRAREESSIRTEILGISSLAATRVALPLSARGEIEVTTLAVAPGISKQTLGGEGDEPVVVTSSGFVFVGECRGLDFARSQSRTQLIGDVTGQTEHALRSLESALARANTALGDVLRLEVYLRDIYQSRAVADKLRQLIGKDLPSIVIAGAELEDSLEIKLNAIAAT